MKKAIPPLIPWVRFLKRG